ncbi:GTP pyrophosphokinase [Oceanobacillus polygoni]|uniref:GTP pyrophosphokinase n=1 Tax=Oceanobacillus polygoni TaxID=1235259 RepID=A0A9X1CH31_9BACI|nr:GTP pyrophosphokinase family protein [Oceanobacillus polygoni]MBP2078580.1 putative GTP pyrophosphokinase [Oceanobacillus polygoni]
MNQLQQLKQVRNELTRFMITYKFGLDEMNTKLNILKEEFQYIHSYNPIEHIKSRIKSPESILKKVYRKNLDMSMDSIRENVKDIVGIRIVCSFISDIYKISEMIQHQEDITVIEVKDYIKDPKPNGYKSLHLILSIPVFMSDRTEQVFVEIQIRSVAMDFWASLEHKIYYKYNGNVPQHLIDELTDTANIANQLDLKMEKLNNDVNNVKSQQTAENEDIHFLQLNEEKVHLPLNFLNSFLERKK